MTAATSALGTVRTQQDAEERDALLTAMVLIGRFVVEKVTSERDFMLDVLEARYELWKAETDLGVQKKAMKKAKGVVARIQREIDSENARMKTPAPDIAEVRSAVLAVQNAVQVATDKGDEPDAVLITAKRAAMQATDLAQGRGSVYVMDINQAVKREVKLVKLRLAQEAWKSLGTDYVAQEALLPGLQTSAEDYMAIAKFKFDAIYTAIQAVQFFIESGQNYFTKFKIAEYTNNDMKAVSLEVSLDGGTTKKEVANIATQLIGDITKEDGDKAIRNRSLAQDLLMRMERFAQDLQNEVSVLYDETVPPVEEPQDASHRLLGFLVLDSGSPAEFPKNLNVGSQVWVVKSEMEHGRRLYPDVSSQDWVVKSLKLPVLITEMEGVLDKTSPFTLDMVHFPVTCKKTPSEFYSTVGSKTRASCTNINNIPGNASLVAGAGADDECWACDAGYDDQDSNDTCEKTAAGFYSPAGSSQRYTCSPVPSDVSVSTEVGLTSLSECWICNDAGYDDHDGNGICRKTVLGFYSPANSNERFACSPPPPSFASQINTQSCDWACNAGYDDHDGRWSL